MPQTKYTKKHGWDRGLDSRKDKIIIADPAYDNEIAYYHCDSCSLNIGVRLSNQQEEIKCSHCGEVIALSKARKVSKLTTPHQNTETLVASVSSPYEKDIRIKHEPVYKGSFAEMSKRVRFTSYEERGGGGNPIHEED